MPLPSSLFSDTETSVVATVAAVIYSPAGKGRKRFPEGVVEVHANEDAARAHADPARHRYAALASGPSRSSEGFRLYYLVRWLD